MRVESNGDLGLRAALFLTGSELGLWNGGAFQMDDGGVIRCGEIFLLFRVQPISFLQVRTKESACSPDMTFSRQNSVLFHKWRRIIPLYLL